MPQTPVQRVLAFGARLPFWAKALWSHGLPERLQTARQALKAPSSMAAALWRIATAPEHAVSKIVRLHAQTIPDHAALTHNNKTLTYQELDQSSDRLAARLSQAVGVRDTVAVMLPNTPLFIQASLATSRLRAHFLPIGTQSKRAETGYILRNAKPKVLIISSEYTEHVDPSLVAEGCQIWVSGASQVEPPFETLSFEDTAPLSRPSLWERVRKMDLQNPSQVIMYTSGTTGKPKGAARNINDTSPESILNLATALDLDFSERLFVCTPLYHAAPWAMTALALGFGGQVFLSERWKGQETLDDIARAQATAWLVVPTLVRRWLDLPGASCPPTLRKVYSTGSRFPGAWKTEASARFGPLFYDFYGATELGIISVANPQDCIERPTSVGKILSHIEVKLQPTPDHPPNQGILFAHGQNFSGYTHADAAGDGFFSVGDIAEIKDGYLYIIDRASDMIISGGVNLYPAEIEGVLREHPCVTDAAVVGVPDDTFGEAVAAFVVPSGTPPTPEDLVKHCEARLAKYKKPKHIRFVDALPTSPQGKILKRQLIANWLGSGSSPQAPGQ